jgi:hypothetical protein
MEASEANENNLGLLMMGGEKAGQNAAAQTDEIRKEGDEA